jgi:SAM-dependent methyltransferase
VKTYLPEINIDDLINAIWTNNWSNVEEKIFPQKYERVGIDRALSIVIDLIDSHQNLPNLKILDVGCNNGLIANVLAALKCDVTGIDNGAVDSQEIYKNLKHQYQSGAIKFQNVDLLDLLKSHENYWDCIFLLSVTHHWETGYAMSGKRKYSDNDIHTIFVELFRRTRLTIYYECPLNEPGFEAGSGVDFLHRFCIEPPKLRFLGNTIGPNGYLRQLWAIDME